MYLEEIVNDVALENAVLECKARLNRQDIVSWLKTIAGFANSMGGHFYIGVEDKTNKLIGFDRIQADNERNFLNNQINEHLTPRPKINITFIRYEINKTEKFIISVKVEPDIKPVILKFNNIPSIYMRRDGFTNGATYEEIIDMSINSNKKPYDLLISDQEYNYDDFKTLRKFYSDHNDGKEISEKQLLSLGFFNADGYLSNGAVLFNDNYNGNKTEILCSVFSGFNKGSKRVVSLKRFNGNLIDSIEFAMEFVDQRMNHGLVKTNNGHIDIDSFPKRALYEGIINAIAHRDYYIDGSQIQIDMFKDRLEITSPGPFYKNENISKTFDLTSVISKRRNMLITDVFIKCHVMEAAGTGFEKIVYDYANADFKHKPYIFSNSSQFTLVLPDLTFEEGPQDETLPHIRYIPVSNGTAHDNGVLSYCYYKAHKTDEIVNKLNLSNSSYFRKHVLDNLVKQNYLVMDKIGRTVYYKTNTEMVEID